MHKREFILLFILLLYLQCFSQRQKDTAISLAGVTITENRISVFSKGLKTERIDSIYISLRAGSNIGALLSEKAFISVRSYGVAGSSSLNARGTYASQSGVFWNGINIGVPNMGSTDLSRISPFLFKDVTLQLGGSGALMGSGVIGGSLQLSNTPVFEKRMKAQSLMYYNNAGIINTGIKINAGNNKLFYLGVLNMEDNENNFKYKDFDGSRKRLKHAHLQSFSHLHQLDYKLNMSNYFSWGLWYQQTYRELPPNKTQLGNDETMNDEALRAFMQWKHIRNKQWFIIKTGYFHEFENYNKKNAFDADYISSTLFAEAEHKIKLSGFFTLGSGVAAKYVTADIKEYGDVKSRHEGSVSASVLYNQPHDKLKATLSMRQDFIEGYEIPLLPLASVEIPVYKDCFVLNIAASRNFRTPTFNDKFWIPGGNPDLKPEDSWNEEIGLTYKYNLSDRLNTRFSASFYNINMKNLIQWVPVKELGGLWSPMNVEKVWSRGVECSLHADWNKFLINGNFELNYTYSPSTKVEDGNETKQQLIYIPLHKANVSAMLTHKSYFLHFTSLFCDKRYTMSNNTEFLKSYYLSDIIIGKIFIIKDIKLKIQGEVKNIFDFNYENRPYYQEPGRNYGIQIILSN